MTDQRKERQPQYFVFHLGGAAQLIEQYTGTLPDCREWCAGRVSGFPAYLKLYRSLALLPLWAGAFLSQNSRPIILVISKQSDAGSTWAVQDQE